MGNKVVKASFWYIFSTFLLKGISIITSPIFARILTQDEFGQISNFSAWLSIFMIVASLSLNSSMVRARFDYKDDLYSYTLSVFLLGMAFASIISILLFINHDLVSEYLKIENRFLIIFVLCIIFNPAYEYFLTIQRFEYKYKLVTVLSVAASIATIVISFLFMYLLKDNLMGRLIGLYAPELILAICSFIYFLIKGRNISTDYWKFALPISLPYVVHLLSGTILSSFDRTMITSMCGNVDNALYSMACTLAGLVNTVWVSMNNAYIPWFGERMHEGGREEISKYGTTILSIFIFLLFGILLVTPEAILILGGDQYMPCIYAVPPLILGYYFIAVYTFYVNIEQYEKQTKGMAIATMIAALFNIVTNYIFVPIFGYIAAAYTTLAGYILLMLLHYYFVKRMGLQNIYNRKNIVLLSCLAMGLGGLTLILYKLSILRYIIISVYVVVFFVLAAKNKDAIIKLFK